MTVFRPENGQEAGLNPDLDLGQVSPSECASRYLTGAEANFDVNVFVPGEREGRHSTGHAV